MGWLGMLPAAAMERTWTNRSGQSLQAELVGVKGGKVVLKDPSGESEIEVALDDLSQSDQEFVASWETQQKLAEAKFPKALQGKLVRLEKDELVPIKDHAPRELYALYYSAGWCGPCRNFTPDLVRFYRRLKDEELAKVDVIFVTSDRSSASMVEYMEDAKMEWPAIPYNLLQKRQIVHNYEVDGIPCLILVDADGKVVSHSYEDGEYRGPREVLKDLEDWLDENS